MNRVQLRALQSYRNFNSPQTSEENCGLLFENILGSTYGSMGSFHSSDDLKHDWSSLFDSIQENPSAEDRTITPEEFHNFLDVMGVDSSMKWIMLREFKDMCNEEEMGMDYESFCLFMKTLPKSNQRWTRFTLDVRFLGVTLGLMGTITLLVWSIVIWQGWFVTMGRAMITCGLLSLTKSEYERVSTYWRDMHKLLSVMDFTKDASKRKSVTAVTRLSTMRLPLLLKSLSNLPFPDENPDLNSLV